MLNPDLKSQILSVSQFNQLIDEIISPLQVIVEGELSQINTNSGRWFFATLKDNQASVSIFSPLGRIPNWQVLQEGMRVRVDGWPKIYQKTGRFSLFARSIAPAGRGALKEAYEKLKQDLMALGYFDPARKRALPRLVRRIGLITAPGSRAYSDFVSVLADQSSGLRIDFYPVLVQGDEAINQIVQALDFFNQRAGRYDLLVLTRGGGSLEDLLPFNSRVVAEAVYGAKVPLLAAIGHEADDCLIDLVADFRSSTPTAAAQMIKKHQEEALLMVDSLVQGLIDSYQGQILVQKDNLVNFANRLTFYYQNQFQESAILLARFASGINSFLRQIQTRQKARYSLEKLLLSYDHRAILKRGFTLTLDERAKIVKNPSKVSTGDKITTRFYQGQLVSEVKNK
jgi:exodeoxyribonuclease VII large subunit